MRKFAVSLLVLLALCLICGIAAANTLVIPDDVIEIEEEAFCGDTSIDEIVLPEGIQKIGARAFADSSVHEINLPDGLTEIADNAFDDSSLETIHANEGSYAYNWAIRNGYVYKDFVYLGFHYYFGRDGVHITDYTGNTENLYIPVEIETKPVTVIEEYVGISNQYLNSIHFPETLTNIGRYSFSSCSNLETIEFSSLVEIDKNAFNSLPQLHYINMAIEQRTAGSFQNCDQVKAITYFRGADGIMPDWEVNGSDGNNYSDRVEYRSRTRLTQIVYSEGVTHIGNYAYAFSSGFSWESPVALTEIQFPSTLVSIGNHAFSHTHLKSINLPEGLLELGDYCFEQSDLELIKIPSTMRVIGRGCFSSCNSLKNVLIEGSSLRQISDYAFYSCQSLENFMIPESVEQIGSYAFGECTALISPIVLNNIHEVRAAAFYNCRSVNRLELGNNDVTVGFNAFACMEQLEEITIPAELDGNNLFLNCKNIRKIHFKKGKSGIIPDMPGKSNELDSYGRVEYESHDSIMEVSFEEGITSIGKDVFREIQITEINLPDSLTSLGAGCLAGTAITSINLPDSLTSLGEGCLEGTAITSIRIPDGVGVIPKSCFQNCRFLADIQIPTSLSVIDEYAFSGCISIPSVPGFQSQYNVTINRGAFEGCTGLPEELIIPANVIGIDNAFLDCGITRIVFPNEMVSGQYKFYNMENVTEITIPVDADTGEFLLDPDLASEGYCWTDKVCHIETIRYTAGKTGRMPDWDRNYTDFHDHSFISRWETTTIIGENGIAPPSLKTVIFDEGITHIGDYAFYECTNLSAVYLPSTLKSIGDFCFFETALTGISFPENLSSIGSSAFYGTKLYSLVLPDAITDIPDRCFYGTSISEISYPAQLKTIGERAFAGCVNLRSIDIPVGVQKLGELAFAGCAQVTSIHIPDSVMVVGFRPFQDCTSVREISIPCDISIGNVSDCLETICYSRGQTGVSLNWMDQWNGENYNYFGDMEKYACNSLKTVEYLEGVTQIGPGTYGGVFSEDEFGISELIFPNSLRSIEFCSFLHLSALTKLTIPFDITFGEDYRYEQYGVFTSSHSIKQLVFRPGQSGNIGSGTYYIDRESIEHVMFEEGIKTIPSCLFQGHQNLESVQLPNSLLSIEYRAFYNVPNLKRLNIGEKCAEIGENNFAMCPKLWVRVNRYNSYAISWLKSNFVPYYFEGQLNMKFYHSWLYYQASEPLYVFSIADGGVRPYHYRFTLMKDGEIIERTDWMTTCYTYFYPENKTDNWFVFGEVMDDVGTIITSSNEQIEEYIDYTDQIALRRAFFNLVDSAPSSSSLNGYMFNEGMQEVSWLNTVIDLLHADLSILKTQELKQQYLFEEAFKASASGNTISLLDDLKLPTSVKALGKIDGLLQDDYYNALVSLTDAYGFVPIDTTKENLKDLFKSFDNGSIDENTLTSMLGSTFYHISSENMDNAKGIFKSIKTLKTLNTYLDGIGYAVSVGGGLFDIYNQVQLLQAMNPSAARKMANTYLANSDPAYQVAGNRLLAIVNASGNIVDQAALIVSGTVADVGIDLLLDTIKLSKGHPIISAVYFATDYITGSGSYAKAMNTLQWACDAMYYAETDFIYAVSAYTRQNSDETFSNLMYCYTNYLEMAASVEEAYVDVIKWQEKTPICDTPSFVLQQKNVSSQKAEALRALSKKVRSVKDYYEAGSYAEAAAWLTTCAEDQSRLKTLGFTTISEAGGGGGGGGW